jgi:transposase-like protein
MGETGDHFSMASTTSPDPAPKPRRRTFSPEYKLRIVAEYDAAPPGEKGAILRRERLYHSHIIEWRQARDAGAMATLTDRRTSPARPKKAAEQAELERLRKKVARLEKDVAKRDAALEVLGKAHALLEMLSEGAD